MAHTGPTDAQILQDARAEKGCGERGYILYERTTIRPALTVNGIVGGYQGPGGKAIIPASAVAKLNFILVPDQDPHEIERLIRQHIARITSPIVCSSVCTLFGAKPALVNRRHLAIRAAAAAYCKGFGMAPVFLRSGGTIPVVSTFQEMLGIPTVLMGFALPDGRMHAPNEKFHLPNFHHGIVTCIWFLAEVGAGTRTGSPASAEAGRTDAPIEPYLRRARAAGIDKTIVVAAFHSNYAKANAQLARIIARYPTRLIGFAFVHARRDAGRIGSMVERAVTEWGGAGTRCSSTSSCYRSAFAQSCNKAAMGTARNGNQSTR